MCVPVGTTHTRPVLTEVSDAAHLYLCVQNGGSVRQEHIASPPSGMMPCVSCWQQHLVLLVVIRATTVAVPCLCICAVQWWPANPQHPSVSPAGALYSVCIVAHGLDAVWPQLVACTRGVKVACSNCMLCCWCCSTRSQLECCRAFSPGVVVATSRFTEVAAAAEASVRVAASLEQPHVHSSLYCCGKIR